MKYTYHILIYALLCCLMCSCNKSELKRLSFEDLKENRFQKTIDDILEECKTEATLDAEVHVDSMIDRLLKKDLIDTLEFPDKPVRPVRPEEEN